MKAKFKLILGRRKQYPLNIELEVYKGVDCRVFIQTGITLDNAKQWDEARQIVVRHDCALAYNAMFKTTIQNIERAELEIENRGGLVTKDLIRKAAANRESIDEIDAIDKFFEYVYKWDVSENTEKYNVSCVNSLKRYVMQLKNSKTAKLLFSEINLPFIEGYNEHLLKTVKPITASSRHLIIRKCVDQAVREGYLKFSSYDKFDVALERPEQRPALTTDQLTLLESLTRKEYMNLTNIIVSISLYEYAVDQFLFSCYTGLRISDNISLLKSEVHRNANGLVVQKVTKKTGELVTLPLYLLFNGKPQEIAYKYLKTNKGTDKLFRLNEKQLRHALKNLFRKLGFSRDITFHTARHTCATLLAEKVDNPFVIKDILGHTGIGTSMTYIKKSHRTAEKKLKQVNWHTDGSLPERNIVEMCCDLRKICEGRQLSSVQTMLIVGFLMGNRDKYELIKIWIENSDCSQMSCDSLNDKLQSLLTANC